MLNADDPSTRPSLNLLKKTVVVEGRPLVLWLGAGVSMWAGLPSWKDLARQFHREFSLLSANYPKEEGKLALQAARYPDVFQICRQSDSGLYNSQLAASLHVDHVPTLYSNFINKIQSFSCKYLVTTNADELLEQNLPSTNTLQRSDLERMVLLIQSKKSCLAKLHGSISSVESLIFTTEDYDHHSK
jgi:NAD-dependent SIR2 family protein deacetylase